MFLLLDERRNCYLPGTFAKHTTMESTSRRTTANTIIDIPKKECAGGQRKIVLKVNASPTVHHLGGFCHQLVIPRQVGEHPSAAGADSSPFARGLRPASKRFGMTIDMVKSTMAEKSGSQFGCLRQQAIQNIRVLMFLPEREG